MRYAMSQLRCFGWLLPAFVLLDPLSFGGSQKVCHGHTDASAVECCSGGAAAGGGGCDAAAAPHSAGPGAPADGALDAPAHAAAGGRPHSIQSTRYVLEYLLYHQIPPGNEQQCAIVLLVNLRCSFDLHHEATQTRRSPGSVASADKQNWMVQALDRVLRGGCPCGSIIELVGPAGIGKTQLCLQLAAIAASLPVDAQSDQVCLNARHASVTTRHVAAAMLPVLCFTISGCAHCCQCCASS